MKLGAIKDVLDPIYIDQIEKVTINGAVNRPGSYDLGEGITLLDDIKNNIFPEPLISSEKNDVYVGRIVGDFYGDKKKFSMLISGDQLLKGAALNALQIYERF